MPPSCRPCPWKATANPAARWDGNGRYGAGRDELYDIPFLPRRWDEACQPFSGDVDFLPAGGHGPSATIWLVQERPLPFHLLALSLDVEFAEI